MLVNPNSDKSYLVGKKVAETERYRLYLCRPEGAGAACLLQIASKLEYNGVLDRAVYHLDRLSQEAERIEEEYTHVKANPKHFLNYKLSFPETIDTFVAPDQRGRRVSILRFRGVEDVRQMVPLHTMVHLDKLRVDLRTSVWIMGKLLKTLIFAHDAHFVVNNLVLGNILLEPDQHYVVIFNWADAQLCSDEIPQSTVRAEVRAAACCVLEVIDAVHPGGDTDAISYLKYVHQLVEGLGNLDNLCILGKLQAICLKSNPSLLTLNGRSWIGLRKEVLPSPRLPKNMASLTALSMAG